MKNLLIAGVFLLFAENLLAQSTGDYRSFATGNWSTLGTWQLFNGTSWATPTVGEGYPGQNSVSGVVTILNTHTVTLDATPANSIGSLVVGEGATGVLNTTGDQTLITNGNMTINAGGSFTFAGAAAVGLTIGGTSQINGAFIDNENTGTNTYTGLVTISATGSWNTSTTAEIRIYFLGGLTHSGTSFTAGGLQVANGQTITANAAMTISSGMDSDADMNLAGTSTVNLTGDQSNINGNLTMSGSVTLNATSGAGLGPLAITGNLTIGGTSSLILASAANGNFSVGGNTVIDGTFTDSNDAGVDTFAGSVTINAGGTWTSTAVTTAGRLIFQNGISHSGTTFNANIATFNTRDQIISGTSALNFSGVVTVTGFVLTNNGTINITSVAVGSLTGTGTFTQGTGTLNYSGQTITITAFNASGVGNTVNYQRAGAQTIFNPTAGDFHHLTISGSGTKTLAANADIEGNVTIGGTAILSVNALYDMNVAGNWTNTSTNADPLAQGGRTITFDGVSASQVITNTGDAQGTEFGILILNNTYATSPQFSLAGTSGLNVVTTLTMTAGVLDLNSLTVTLGTGVGTRGTLSHGGSSANGWMYDGNFMRWFSAATIANGNAQGLFPMGNSTDEFAPFYVSCPATAPTTGGTVRVSFGEGYGVSVVSFADGGSTVISRHDAPWTVVTANGLAGGTYNLRGEGTGFGEITNVSDLRLTLAGSAIGTAGTNAGSTTNPQVNRTGLTLANLTNGFYIGSVSLSSPLPVELIYFGAERDHEVVAISWSTASETSNDYFVVERSLNNENWEEVARTKGAGDSNTRLDYTSIDSRPLNRGSYYHLKQVDFDGTFSFSNTVFVPGQESTIDEFAYPNPFSSGNLNISLSAFPMSAKALSIYDLSGNVVYYRMLESDFSEEMISLDRNDLKTPGLYIIVISSAVGTKMNKLLVK